MHVLAQLEPGSVLLRVLSGSRRALQQLLHCMMRAAEVTQGKIDLDLPLAEYNDALLKSWLFAPDPHPIP